MRKSKISKLGLFFITYILFIQSSHADDNFIDFLSQTTVSGDVRDYFFTRTYDEMANPANQSAFSLGGNLNLESATFADWLRVDVDFFTAQPFDINSPDNKYVDNTLPGFQVNTIGQAFLQYQNDNITIRGGDQIMNTPWLGPSDSRMIPATYQGFLAIYTPIPDLTFTALRQTAFKSRTSVGFSGLNLYNVNDQIFGGTPLAKLGNTTDIGTLAFGSTYQNNNTLAEAWAYQFYDFAKLLYGNFNYTLNSPYFFKPIFGAQVARETGDGSNLLAENGYGFTDSDVLGALLGVAIPHGKLTLGYDDMPIEDGAFHNGDLVSPYTTGYASDPLYTTSLIAGLIEKTAGHALKLTASYNLLNDTIKLSTSYAKYYTAPLLADTYETDFDVTYLFSNRLKGLSIRNRFGVMHGNNIQGHFIYNRLMLEYDF